MVRPGVGQETGNEGGGGDWSGHGRVSRTPNLRHQEDQADGTEDTSTFGPGLGPDVPASGSGVLGWDGPGTVGLVRRRNGSRRPPDEDPGHPRDKGVDAGPGPESETQDGDGLPVPAGVDVVVEGGGPVGPDDESRDGSTHKSPSL